ncbi:MAG: NAD(P)-dependent oxidoreductase [Bacillota bacterium]|nr:NAD(P)-dependent oxidoreductase [Bacillota bacterium]
MKTVLVEPLTISQEKLQGLAKELNENGHVFVAYDSKPENTDQWLERTKDADQIILANTKMPAEVIKENPKLKYINIAFTGTDHVPVDLALERDIIVSNAAGYSDQGVAELVIGMTINILRDIKKADWGTRNGMKTSDFLGQEIYGKKVGIIGTGNIGLRTAELFKAFGADLYGYNRSQSQKAKDLGIEFVSLDELLEKSDIITVHLPLNDSTRNTIGQAEFAKMKETAIFVNCARGPIVNTEALVDALKNKKIAGAAIDVYDTEPPFTNGEEILDQDLALLTPHIAYFTKESMEKRAAIVFENALDFLNGREIKTRVDK